MSLWQVVPIWAILVITIICLYITYWNRKLKYWTHLGIQSPINNVWEILKFVYMSSKTPHHINQIELYKKYGRIFGSFFATQPVISIAEPDILKKILVKDFNMFHNRLDMKTGEDCFDKMLSIVKDEDWKRIRCIMSPTFSSGKMRKMAYLVKECAEDFATFCEKLANDDKPIDCKKYFSCYSFDVIASTAFGTKLDSLKNPDNEFITAARKMSSSDVSLLMAIIFITPGAMKLFKVDFFKGSLNYFKTFVKHVIQQRDQQKIRANDFLQLMLDAQRGVLEEPLEDIKEVDENEKLHTQILPKHKTMSMEEMLAQCVVFLFAGNETTTNTLSYILYYLALYPECQEKLIKEVDEIWRENDVITFDVINKMPYLDSVINETLRMEPISFQLMRVCTEDYVSNEIGITISKGVNVLIPIYAMHRDPEFFPNPDKFDPERFSPENCNSIPQYAYLPFGDGPRNCVGMRFATMVLKMCLVMFFKKLKVVATEETKKPLEFYLGQGILQPKQILVKFVKRT